MYASGGHLSKSVENPGVNRTEKGAINKSREQG